VIRRDQDGSAPISLALGVGLLVFPVLLLVLSLPTWEARSVDARDAAAAAARALVTADTWSDGVAAADAAVYAVASTDGVASEDLSATYSGSLTRGAAVTAEVTVTIPAGRIPGIASFGAVHYSASSTQQVDDYRSLG